ncbi:signal peptidase I [Haloplanus halophilus]|uniref:signal peptidase I n=1 Tax=Haloplanus halophilus TaxID=2949993 RepID=UPI00203CC479|nr:signal peptidase I [Haloplanus sp. GDY1]
MNLTTHSRTAGRALLVVVLLALIAPFVVYAVPGTVGAEASYVVLTASMTPAIAPGDVVVVDEVPARSVRVGDVIVFEQQAGGEVPVTHRVIGVERAGDGTPAFVTKGDANEDADLGPVTPDRLIGRVVLTIPLIGHVIQFVGTPLGFVALVVLPLGLLIASEVADLLRSGRPDPAATTAADGDDDGDGVPATGTGGDGGPDESPAGTDDQFTFTQRDLTLASVVLGVVTAYAGYSAYQRPSGIAVGVAVAAGAGFVLAAGMRSFAPSAPVGTQPAVTDGGDGTTPVGVPSVRIDRGATAGPTVEVAGPADLRAIAAAVSRPLLRADDRYVVLDGAVTYACDVPADPDPEATAAADDEAVTDAADGPETADDASDADGVTEPRDDDDGATEPRDDDGTVTTLSPDGGAER